jgi:YD repeat-containing protein
MDLVGSRLSKVHDAAGTAEDETISSTYNANDQLLTTDNGQLTTTYTYDANGSLTATTGATAATYGYDLRNRMVSATVDGVAATYTYDDRGVRVSKTENGVTTYYTVDHANPTGYAQVLEEKSSAVPGATPDKDDERGRS